MKRCSRCGEERPLSDFCRHRISKDGLSWDCASCRRERNHLYAQRAKSEGKKKSSKPHSLRSRRPWWREAKRAQERVRYALATGRMIRPDTCLSCGNDARVQAHHEDYSKPLEVVWLCAFCHRALHAGNLVLAPRDKETA